MPKRTYLDASVLIGAIKGESNVAQRAMQVLDDAERKLVTSDALWLEVMPKPLHHRKEDEVATYKAIFAQAEHLHWDLEVLEQATKFAAEYGLAAMDAIHVATALHAKVDEFVTAEKPTKAFFTVRGLVVRSLQQPLT